MEGATRETGYAKAMQVFELMKSEGVQPCHITYSILIDAAGHAGKPEAAEAHFAAMTTNPRPDTNNYNSLIEALARNGQLDKAERVLDNMLRTSDVGPGGSSGDRVSLVRPTAKSFSSLLGFCLERNDLARARRLADKMKRARVEPDAFAQRQLDLIPPMSQQQHQQAATMNRPIRRPPSSEARNLKINKNI
jgi:pentatricopeptide repeat protein